MRILVFVEKFMWPTLSFVYNELTYLSKENEVLLITNQRINEEDFPFDNIRVIPFKENKLGRKIKWLLETNDIWLNRKSAYFSKEIRKVMNEFRPEVIHAHFGYEAIKLLDNLNDISTPILITFHGYDASQMLRRKAYVKKLNCLLNKFNFISICVSGFIRQNLISAGVHLRKTELLYCGTDTEFFTPPVTNDIKKPFTFLQISTFNEKKGHVYTLQAFKKFLSGTENKKEYKLVLAGGWILFEEIKELCAQMDLNEYVEFPGIVNATQARELLAAADVFVHHSVTASNGDTEGLPTAIMEAMAMELPILSTYHAGIPELIEDSVNGYLVREKDVDAYARRMSDIVSWKKLPLNREKIVKDFSRKGHNEKLFAIYKTCINEKADG